MEDLQHSFSLNFWPLLIVGFGGFLLFFVLNLSRRIIKLAASTSRLNGRIQEKWPLLERLLWMLFALSSLVAFIKPNPIAGSIVSVILVATSWVFIRNFMAGILILVEAEFKVGQSIRYEGYEGKIKSLKPLNCELVLDDSGKEVVSIPNSKLSGSVLVRTSPSEHIVSISSVVSIPLHENLAKAEGKIESIILNMPWLIRDEGHAFERLDDSESFYNYKIVLHGIDKLQLREGMQHLKASLRSEYNI